MQKIMKTAFFLYDYSPSEKEKFLARIEDSLEDLIFVFEQSSGKVVFHNNCFCLDSEWESILFSPILFEAVRNKVHPNDFPFLMQLLQSLKNIDERCHVIRELHILGKDNLYAKFQLDISLFEKSGSMSPLLKCKVHLIPEQKKLKDFFDAAKGFTKVILVDDDELTNILNKKIINSVLPAMATETFLDIDDALEWLKDNDKNGDFLIFLDLNFPRRSGWDFLEEYKVFDVLSKVVMLSSSIVQSDKIKAFSYKFVLQFMSKPLSFDFLETKLK